MFPCEVVSFLHILLSIPPDPGGYTCSPCLDVVYGTKKRQFLDGKWVIKAYWHTISLFEFGLFEFVDEKRTWKNMVDPRADPRVLEFKNHITKPQYQNLTERILSPLFKFCLKSPLLIVAELLKISFLS